MEDKIKQAIEMLEKAKLNIEYARDYYPKADTKISELRQLNIAIEFLGQALALLSNCQAKPECETCEWISVNDRLPKRGMQVFMIDADTGYAYVGWMDEPKNWWYFTADKEKSFPSDNGKEITHWMSVIPPDCQGKPEQPESELWKEWSRLNSSDCSDREWIVNAEKLIPIILRKLEAAERENTILTGHIMDADNKAQQQAERISQLEDIFNKIENWCKAYPIDIFPKPDLKKAHTVLESAGMTLDAITADAMRHVTDGIKDLIEKKG